jgi:hypothetical protein
MLATVARKPSSEKGNDKRLVVYITEEMYNKLELAAKKEDRSISNYARNLLSSILESKDSDND